MTHDLRFRGRIVTTLAASIACLACATSAVAEGTVDLDAPDALAALHDRQPDHYAKVVRILRDAERLPQPQLEGWVKTAYAASDVSLGAPLLVSYPAKRRLLFRLDDVAYSANVRVSIEPAIVLRVR